MNLLLAAKSGWGKSWMCQRLTELNAKKYDRVLVLDFKDEYRGLVSARHGPGLMKYWMAGRNEVEQFTTAHYGELLEQNDRVVLARQPALTEETWREDVCAPAIRAARRLEGSVLIVIDEAHFVAPQSGSVPDVITGLATTGRGEGVSGMWVTQRLTECEETVLAQCEGRFLGGFGSDADLNKVEKVLEYPTDLHRAGGEGFPAEYAEALGFDPGDRVDENGQFVGVRKFTEDDGETVVGSEWVHSNDDGDVELADSREMEMESEHVGKQGHAIEVGL